MPSQETDQNTERAAAVRATIAANIDRGIRAKGFTNRTVAEKIGSTEHQVWRWRRGRHMPSLEALIGLARELFDGDMAQLYADESLAA